MITRRREEKEVRLRCTSSLRGAIIRSPPPRQGYRERNKPSGEIGSGFYVLRLGMRGWLLTTFADKAMFESTERLLHGYEKLHFGSLGLFSKPIVRAPAHSPWFFGKALQQRPPASESHTDVLNSAQSTVCATFPLTSVGKVAATTTAEISLRYKEDCGSPAARRFGADEPRPSATKIAGCLHDLDRLLHILPFATGLLDPIHQDNLCRP